MFTQIIPVGLGDCNLTLRDVFRNHDHHRNPSRNRRLRAAMKAAPFSPKRRNQEGFGVLLQPTHPTSITWKADASYSSAMRIASSLKDGLFLGLVKMNRGDSHSMTS
jgi:hypothetical protein